MVKEKKFSACPKRKPITAAFSFVHKCFYKKG